MGAAGACRLASNTCTIGSCPVVEVSDVESLPDVHPTTNRAAAVQAMAVRAKAKRRRRLVAALGSVAGHAFISPVLGVIDRVSAKGKPWRQAPQRVPGA